jgi:hypothetical protein
MGDDILKGFLDLFSMYPIWRRWSQMVMRSLKRFKSIHFLIARMSIEYTTPAKIASDGDIMKVFSPKKRPMKYIVEPVKIAKFFKFDDMPKEDDDHKEDDDLTLASKISRPEDEEDEESDIDSCHSFCVEDGLTTGPAGEDRQMTVCVPVKKSDPRIVAKAAVAKDLAAANIRGLHKALVDMKKYMRREDYLTWMTHFEFGRKNGRIVRYLILDDDCSL